MATFISGTLQTIIGLLFLVEPVVRFESGTLMFDSAINFRIQQIIVQNWRRESDHYGHTIYLHNTFEQFQTLNSMNQNVQVI